jgi:hypothetical protein
MRSNEIFVPLKYKRIIEMMIMPITLPIKYELYRYEVKDNVDFIVSYGEQLFMEETTHKRVHNELSMLIDILNIALFYKTYIDSNFLWKAPDRNSPLFKILISKILDFTTLYGDWDYGYENLSCVEYNHISIYPQALAQSKSQQYQNVLEFINTAKELYNSYYQLAEYVENQDHDYTDEIDMFKGFGVLSNIPICPMNRVGFKKAMDFDIKKIFDMVRCQLIVISVMKSTRLKQCPFCRQFFKATGKQLFCSPSHKNLYHRGKLYNEVKLCKNCNTSFISKHQSELYCCNRCKRVASYKRAKEKSTK